MAEDYSTIQQHQPLRVPAKWDKQEKAFVVQLEEVLDDIYRRFGRLRLEDMGKKFRKKIEDDEGNIAELVIDVGNIDARVESVEGDVAQITIDIGNIELVVADKYDKVSGIAIDSGGVAISGSKSVEIGAGCELKVASGGNIDIDGSGNLKLTGSAVEIKSGSTFDVQSTNFEISSTGKRMVCGDWTFDDNGAKLELENGKYYRIEGLTAFTDMGVGTHIKRYAWTQHPTYVSWGYGIASVLFNNGLEVEKGELLFCYDTVEGAWTLIPEKTFSASDTRKYLLGTAEYEYDKAYINKISSAESERLKLTYLRHNSSDYYAALYYNATDTQHLAFTPHYIDETYTGSEGSIGASTYKWANGYIDTINYVTLNQSSSRDIKHDIQDMESVGEKLDELKPVTFVYDDDPEEKKRAGLIYEDTMEVMPEICTGDESHKAINYVELVPMLLKEIQELRARVAALEGGT